MKTTFPWGVALCIWAASMPQVSASEWSRFRGPNGSGTAEIQDLPARFGPQENLIWRTPLPPGHSSPVLTADRLFVTAFEGDDLVTLCLDRSTGKILWKAVVKRPRQENLDPRNNAASPSPVTDGRNVFVFFSEFGLIAYDPEGHQRWVLPLGPFNNIYGMGASPILAGDLIILVCDQSTDSYIIGVRKGDGAIQWKTDRPEAKSGHSTPILHRESDGQLQILVPGSFFLTAYAAETGTRQWWVGGLSFEMKSTPVMDAGTVYVNGYGSPLNQPGSHVTVEPFEDAASKADSNGDGQISKEEFPDRRTRGFFSALDLNADGALSRAEWDYYRAAMASTNGMLAIRLGGQGDMTDRNLRWQYHRSVPQLPSPLLYKNVLYMVNDGGVVTSFDPSDGSVIAQGRLHGAIDNYYASPVAGDDKIFMVSESGKVAVLKPGGALDVVTLNDLGESCYATPALADGRIYIRTTEALYCFGTKDGQPPSSLGHPIQMR